MKKLELKIETCRQCPYIYTGIAPYCSYEIDKKELPYVKDGFDPYNGNVILKPTFIIPDWCQLEELQ